MKGNVVMLYPIFITMSAFLSVTWADGTTMVTEQTTMVTDDGTDGFTAESTVSTLWQETKDKLNKRDGISPEIEGTTVTTVTKQPTQGKTSKESFPATGNSTETTEEINTTDETLPEIGDPSTKMPPVTTVTEQPTQGKTSKESSPATGSTTISCYVCSSNTTSEDDECYVKQGNQSDKADCDKSCVITHYQREDSKARINVTRSCGQCEDIRLGGGWECKYGQDIQKCRFCCDFDSCNGHIGNGATIILQPNFILTVSATVTGMYLAA